MAAPSRGRRQAVQLSQEEYKKALDDEARQLRVAPATRKRLQQLALQLLQTQAPTNALAGDESTKCPTTNGSRRFSRKSKANNHNRQ
ncbi:hypothetical protein DYB37_003980 [Aphanomyces astaci]|uniref:Uncharacterized protein n=1 Tax=Aphanomyces astaci TaxID=112090 RepID=A0A418FIU9_APHAT|nr:hypothetical protein DYB37_003980 [Aphanomyces astaci]